MKKTRPMTVTSNQVAAATNEPPEQSVNLEVKSKGDTKLSTTKSKVKAPKQ